MIENYCEFDQSILHIIILKCEIDLYQYQFVE